MTQTDRFIREVPKAELHMHIEGSFEPELMFEIADRNRVKLAFPSVDALREAYSFRNLQEFLDIYYTGAKVLLKEVDFYDLTMAYLRKAAEQKIVHTEIFFDPQTHTGRGVPFGVAVHGISAALNDGFRDYGITNRLILCFLRHLSEEAAFETLKEAHPFRELISGVGLDSSEVGHPPSKFSRVFAEAGKAGYILVAHAGEEGPAAYVKEALDLLHVTRIDHGIRSIDDADLVDELAGRQIPLTICPLSNQKLQVVPDLRHHPLKKLLDRGVRVTVNSDDPAYFGGYLNENFTAITGALGLTMAEIREIVCNSFFASLLDEESKQRHIRESEAVYSRFSLR